MHLLVGLAPSSSQRFTLEFISHVSDFLGTLKVIKLCLLHSHLLYSYIVNLRQLTPETYFNRSTELVITLSGFGPLADSVNFAYTLVLKREVQKGTQG